MRWLPESANSRKLIGLSSQAFVYQTLGAFYTRMETMTVSAKQKNLMPMINFLKEGTKKEDFDKRTIWQIHLAVEEILLNIITYAYPDEKGDIEISYMVNEKNDLMIKIKDRGIPFDPLKVPEPDTHAPVEERQVGGLGIFLVQKIMDELFYERKDGCNVLTMIKKGRHSP